MVTDRYWKETECEHGFIGSHDGYSSPPLEAGDWGAMAIDPTFKCPGGSRVELFPATPNYEAAAKEIGSIVRGYEMWKDHQHKHIGVDEGLEGQWAGRIIGNALVGVVLLQEQ